MSLTRRQFTITSTGAITLTVLGCGKQPDVPMADDMSTGDNNGEKREKKPDPPTEPFTVGPPDQYATANVYTQLNESKRVWLISDGTELYALADLCTHSGCGVKFKEDTWQSECPCHESSFTTDGANLPGGKAERALERWAVEIIETDTGPQIQVDPTTPLRKEFGEWDDPDAAVPLT